VHRALDLDALENFIGTLRTASQMRGQSCGLGWREFSIEVTVEISAPLLTRHAGLP
jgi:hypothetical protein